MAIEGVTPELGPPLAVLKPVRRVRLALSAHPASAATVKHAKAPTVTSPGT